MKKKLMTGLFLFTALVLGACSGEEAGGTKVDKEDRKQEVVEKEQNENVLVFEVDGNEQKEEVKVINAPSNLAKKLYLPNEFEEHTSSGGRYQAEGKGEYQDFLFTINRNEIRSDFEKEIYKFEKAEVMTGSKGTEINKLDLEKYPDLKEIYDYVASVKVGIGGTKVVGIKEINGEALYVIMMIKNEEKATNYENFALEILKKVELPTPA
jgi:hypothetical protein